VPAEFYKIILCIVATAVGVGGLALMRRSPREDALLRWLIPAAWAARAALAVGIYALAPELVRHSDAVAFYLPETRELLRGLMPYNGFGTSYGPLFHALLAPGVALWSSAGAITLTMLAAEGLLLASYVRLGTFFGDTLRFRRVAWIAVTSPLFVYWNGVGGYNSVLIALFAGLGLIAAARGRHLAAGLAGAMAFAGCKALGVLAWPAIILYDGSNRWRRAAPIAAMLAILAVGALGGWDVLMPLKRQHDSWSGGNLWFLASVVLPGLHGSVLVSVLSAIALATAITAGTRRFLCLPTGSPAAGFERAVAYLVWILVVFMLLSKKSMLMYRPMLLPFAAHLLLRQSGTLKALVPVLALGLLATVQIQSLWLDEMIASRHFLTTPAGCAVLVADLVRMAALAAIGLSAWRSLAPGRPGGQPGARQSSSR